jgi:radial spoke head protein 9
LEEINEEEGFESKIEVMSDRSEEEEIKVPPKDLTGILAILFIYFAEVDRLAYVVQAIENDCQLCPVGSFKLTPVH